MKAILLAVAVASSVLIASSLYYTSTSKEANPLFDEDLDKAFNHWMMRNGKSYGNNSDKEYRKGVFADNRNTVQKNAQDSTATFTLGLNQFADLTLSEFQSQFMGLNNSPNDNLDEDDDNEESDDEEYNLNAPSSVDWVSAGRVTPVKNQGGCGSCWAFSAVGAIESLYAIKYGNFIDFAEQQLVDCSRRYGNYGCKGGWPTNAFKYAKSHGMTQEYYYPYSGMENQCQTNSIVQPWKISSWHKLWNTERDLKKWLAHQPVSIALDASNIQLYSSGIYNGNCSNQPNHAVLAVGYGNEYGQRYFKIKNSWGTGFGESGYFRLAMSDRNWPGKCGCTSHCSFPK